MNRTRSLSYTSAARHAATGVQAAVVCQAGTGWVSARIAAVWVSIETSAAGATRASAATAPSPCGDGVVHARPLTCVHSACSGSRSVNAAVDHTWPSQPLAHVSTASTSSSSIMTWASRSNTSAGCGGRGERRTGRLLAPLRRPRLLGMSAVHHTHRPRRAFPPGASNGDSGDVGYAGLGWSGRGDVDGAFEQFALVEHGAGTDEGDQVRRVHHAPAGLRGLDQLVGHGDTGGAGTGALGDPGSQAHGGEGRLDRYLERCDREGQ